MDLMSLFKVLTRVCKHYGASRSEIYSLDYYEFHYMLNDIEDIETKAAEQNKAQETGGGMEKYMSSMQNMMPKIPSMPSMPKF